MIREFRNWVAYQKWTFDTGLFLLTLINFILLVMVNSNKIAQFFNISELSAVILSVPAGFLFIWIFGFICVKTGFKREMKRAEVEQNPLVVETLQIVRRLEKRK